MHAKNITLSTVTVRMPDGRVTRDILDVPYLSLPPGTLTGISGASGSGKTTLLRLICGLSQPTLGSVRWGDLSLDSLNQEARDRWRGETVGFVFQDFRLFSALSVLENVLVPATFWHRTVPPPLTARAQELLWHLGVTQWKQRAHTLSRGEQQRVAVARALLLRPPLLLADEPTASLDIDNARVVMNALLAYAASETATLCVVSHDHAALNRLPHRLHLERGRVLPEHP